MRLLWFNLATDADDPILGFTTSWISALARQVERIHVITMRAGRLALPDNVEVYSVGKERGYSEPRRAAVFYRHLFHVLRADRPDVCFSHMIPVFTLLATPALRLYGVPIVSWYAHPSVPFTLKVAHHLSDRMAASSEAGYRYRKDKVVFIGQGIDTDLFSPHRALPPKPPLLLCAGRFSPIKGQMTLLEAVHLLRRKGHEVHCALVGETPERDRAYRNRVADRISERGLQPFVQMVGPARQDDLVSWYRRCFAHVNGGPGGHSLDKVTLEAMACGRPSFTSVLGFRDTLGPWAEWLLFRQDDPQDLAEKMLRLLAADDSTLRRMSRDLRRRVVEQHSLGGLTTRLLTLFETVLLP